ncbi:hypothetical protein ACLKA6_013737 [Drosophila palustris]
MDFFRSGGAEGDRIPSELRSAINIALFQAQQTYMTAMDTQLAEYKNMIRQEMLAFMSQIRETVQSMCPVNPVTAEQQRRQTTSSFFAEATSPKPQQLCAPTESSTAPLTKVSPDFLGNGLFNETRMPQQVPEPAIPLASPISEARRCLNNRENSSVPEALQRPPAEDRSPESVEKHKQLKDGPPRQCASGYSESVLDPNPDLEHRAYQSPWVRVLSNAHALIDGGPKVGVGLHARIKRMVNRQSWQYWPQQQSHTRFQRLVKEADAPQADQVPGKDPVIEALYRPRAGGGAASGGVMAEERLLDTGSGRKKKQLLKYCPAN